MDVENGLKLLSLDASGPQAVSQLRILDHVMDKISQDDQGSHQADVKRPCDVFDVIGGVGIGGLIAIFLVVFRMPAQEALEEFTMLVVQVYKNANKDPNKQTRRLKAALEGILERHELAKETKLIPADQPTPTCKLIVPVMYKNSIGVTCVLRNHVIRQEPPTNLTLAEAMFATSAIAPMFTPINIGGDFSTFEYGSGALGLSNPIREVIAGAHHAFGDEATVACLLSIGCGHSSVQSLPGTSDSTARIDFLEQLAMDSEKLAQDIGSQTSQFPIYYRFSVIYGPEALQSRAWTDLKTSTARTAVYLKGSEVTELVDRCVDSIKTGHGSATLEQLRHEGGAAIIPPPPLPIISPPPPRKPQEPAREVAEDPLGANDPDPISASVNQAIIYGQSGRYARALELQLEVLRQRKQQLGPDDPKTIAASVNLAITYSQLERYDDAEVLEQEVLRRRRKKLGDHHPDTLDASASLAITYGQLRRYAEAEVLEVEVLEQRKHQLGTDDPKTIIASANLAATYSNLRRHADAAVLKLEVLTQRRKQPGNDHPDTIDAAASLAITYGQLRRYSDAEALEVEVLGQRKQQLGPDDPKTIAASVNLAVTYGQLKRYAEAEVLELEALEQRKQQLGVNHLSTINVSFNLAITYKSLRRYAEAEELLRRVVSSRHSKLGPRHRDTLEAIAVLAVIEQDRRSRRHRVSNRMQQLFDVS